MPGRVGLRRLGLHHLRRREAQGRRGDLPPRRRRFRIQHPCRPSVCHSSEYVRPPLLGPGPNLVAPHCPPPPTRTRRRAKPPSPPPAPRPPPLRRPRSPLAPQGLRRRHPDGRSPARLARAHLVQSDLPSPLLLVRRPPHVVPHRRPARPSLHLHCPQLPPPYFPLGHRGCPVACAVPPVPRRRCGRATDHRGNRVVAGEGYHDHHQRLHAPLCAPPSNTLRLAARDDGTQLHERDHGGAGGPVREGLGRRAARVPQRPQPDAAHRRGPVRSRRRPDGAHSWWISTPGAGRQQPHGVLHCVQREEQAGGRGQRPQAVWEGARVGGRQGLPSHGRH
mmetsp:Transcript_1025/g.1942  ORF Transcript_1025/g.1942 Transcript_1025/m.1942 type:complete len:335 (+) Transcript_1025:647-1651(+)